MKNRLVISLVFILNLSFVYAQTDSAKFNLLSKRGFYYFPEKGDWSIGLNASPFLNYIGNLIGDKNVYYSYNSVLGTYTIADKSPSVAFTAQNPGTIALKYFYTDLRAYRIKILFGFTANKQKMGTGTLSSDDVYLKETALSIGLFFGQEFYKPIKSRIRGYYGYECGIFNQPFNGSLFKDANTLVTGNIEYVDNSGFGKNYSEKGGNTIGISGNGIIGAEWFFSPKISIGGEFGMGLMYANTTERKYDSDTQNLITDSGSRSLELKPYASGDLILHIYF